MSSKKGNEKKCKSWHFKNIKTTLETINLGPKQIKFLINIKNEKTFRDRGSGFVGLQFKELK